MAATKKKTPRKRAISFKAALEPIYLFALLNALLCWGACWLFWERFVFAATAFGLGCFPVVVAVCAYLFLLTKKAR